MGIIVVVFARSTEPALLRVPLLPFLCEHQAVLDTAAALEDVGVVRGFVALANDVGGAELELRRERRGAGPLDVIVIVVGASVLAAHHINFIEAFSVAADAFELWYG